MSIKIILTLIIVLITGILSQSVGDYGETSNSQVGIVGASETKSTILAKCQESESVSSCIAKPTCCHLTNSFGSYTYSACVDIQNNLYQEFCKNFYELNAKEGFVSSECSCMNYFHISSNYLKPGYSILILILVLFYNIQ